MGPDASWRDGKQHDELGGVPRDAAHLEAEVRRLRAELLRAQDELAEGFASKSWTVLHARARRAWETAHAALNYRRRGHG